MDSETMLIFLFALPVLLTQSILLFIDAKKKGAYAWAWGIWGLLQFPCPPIFYYFFVIRPFRKRKREAE
ncbi:transcriptional regulator [Bacillus sp. SD088]|uniref:transcriptional regulator n=1 Tax=Bacillus sp. SD088 TaxID=2782012 RepID=UPI001A96BD42|nr:transcriptional regulator [Bacillus sp. SD088]MBO0991787.1 transcriptional regulator [Bacillus sp. SD088]